MFRNLFPQKKDEHLNLFNNFIRLIAELDYLSEQISIPTSHMQGVNEVEMNEILFHQAKTAFLVGVSASLLSVLTEELNILPGTFSELIGAAFSSHHSFHQKISQIYWRIIFGTEYQDNIQVIKENFNKENFNQDFTDGKDIKEGMRQILGYDVSEDIINRAKLIRKTCYPYLIQLQATKETIKSKQNEACFSDADITKRFTALTQHFKEELKLKISFITKQGDQNQSELSCADSCRVTAAKLMQDYGHSYLFHWNRHHRERANSMADYLLNHPDLSDQQVIDYLVQNQLEARLTQNHTFNVNGAFNSRINFLKGTFFKQAHSAGSNDSDAEFPMMRQIMPMSVFLKRL